MSFFDFNQTDILPYSRTKAAQRDARVSENLKKFNEALQNEKQVNIYKEQIQSDLQFEMNAKNLANTKAISRRRRIQEDAKLESTLTTKTLAKYLAEMVISGLVFDRYYLAKQKGLSDKITTYIEGMFANDIISAESFTNNGNLLMEDAYYELVGLVKDKIRNRDTVDVFSETVIDDILTEAKKSKDLSDKVADNVKKKVTDTIKEEKKISKKKEEEKEDEEEMDKEFSDAADSLDDEEDSDIDGDDSTDGEEDDDSNDEEELDKMEKEIDAEDGEDGDTKEDNSDDEDLDDLDEDEDEDLEDPIDDKDDKDDSSDEPTVDADAEGSSDNTMKITIETDGKNVSVNANKSESGEYLNIFGSSRYKERNSKSLFRNLLEGNITYASSVLTESSVSSGIKMDIVLAETITQYTLLETMFTSKIFNLSPSQLKSLMKSINFNRK